MKKTLALLLTLVIIAVTFISCAPADDSKVNVGYMSGPTGMGMAKLIADNGGIDGNDKYSFTSFDNTTMAMTKLIAGEVDMICYPTNDAATIINQNSPDISVLAINTLGTLFLITDENTTITDINDLSGKTIYTCKNGTPRMILENLIEAYNIDATVSYTIDETEMAAPKDLASQVMAGKIDIAVAPEPIITNILDKKSNFSVDLDLSDAWSEKYNAPLAMGCIVARNDFINQHKSVVHRFLAEYQASISYIADSANVLTSAQYISDAGIIDTKDKAVIALGNLGDAISYVDGDEMKNILTNFYNALGIALPPDTFYYD